MSKMLSYWKKYNFLLILGPHNIYFTETILKITNVTSSESFSSGNLVVGSKNEPKSVQTGNR